MGLKCRSCVYVIFITFFERTRRRYSILARIDMFIIIAYAYRAVTRHNLDKALLDWFAAPRASWRVVKGTINATTTTVRVHNNYVLHPLRCSVRVESQPVSSDLFHFSTAYTRIADIHMWNGCVRAQRELSSQNDFTRHPVH